MSPLGERVRAALREAFALDPRSLALFRVGTGALLLAGLALRARNLGRSMVAGSLAGAASKSWVS